MKKIECEGVGDNDGFFELEVKASPANSNLLYAERDPEKLDELGNYFFKHMDAMTGENLHRKSDIACELGWRDAVIDALLDTLDDQNRRHFLTEVIVGI